MNSQIQEQAIKEQLIARGIIHPKVIKAFREVSRESFLPEDKKDQAWHDGPVAIGHQSTISQPYVVALMTQLLGLKGNEKVLEVGTGSGYQAAILSKLAKKVYSIDISPELTAEAKDRLKALGFANVLLLSGDGSAGYPEAAPYDAIIVTAGSPKIPPPLIAQLKIGGRLVIPVGDELSQTILVATRRAKDIETHVTESVRFVPLVGRYAWRT
ncbi:MAG TPA: protein-L-isoaspartate(D-aspartate) O-methyltransferase [Patescibacteria group bacterium]|nr:protein-L-isoaspartate(D-aspartate) O-methyltransferase [Patescibacteria group bacterium]